MGGRPWNDDEFAILKDMRDRPIEEVARRINRTVSAVSIQMMFLGFEANPEEHREAIARHEEIVRSMWRTHKPYEIAKRVGGARTAYVMAIADRLGLSNPVPTEGRGGFRPRPDLVRPEKPGGYSRETIAWAIANIRTHPEARIIARVVAERRSKAA